MGEERERERERDTEREKIITLACLYGQASRYSLSDAARSNALESRLVFAMLALDARDFRRSIVSRSFSAPSKISSSFSGSL